MSPVGSHVIKLAEGLHVPRLERANYQKWLVLIEAALRHFNLWESHIIAKPPSKPDQPYLINNAKAYSMISATLSKDNEKLAEDLNGIPLSAHLSFAAIKKHHETGNMSAKLELEDELDLIVYDTQVGVKQLYDEMFDIRKLLSQIGVKWSDEDYVRKLLRKLLKGSSHWGNMRTRFDSFTKSNYATADIRTMLAYEEQQLITVMLLPSLDNAEVALHSNNNLRRSNNSKNSSGSNYNNKPHFRGFNNGDNSNDSHQNVQNSNNSSYWPNGKKKVLCNNCGRLGTHTTKDCRAQFSNNRKSNSNYASTPCANSNANDDFLFHNTMVSAKTDYCSISRNSVNEIILDSGATTHMVCNKNWLSNTVPLQNHSVKGSMKTATNAECKGSLQLNDLVVVLY